MHLGDRLTSPARLRPAAPARHTECMPGYGNDLEQIVAQLNRAASENGMKSDSPANFSADMASLDEILRQAVRLGASDLLLIADVPVTLRMGGALADSTGSPLTGESTRNLLLPLLSSAQSQELNRDKFVDLCFSRPGIGRFRANVPFSARNRGGQRAAASGENPEHRVPALAAHTREPC
jgi:hypothetical protein